MLFLQAPAKDDMHQQLLDLEHRLKAAKRDRTLLLTANIESLAGGKAKAKANGKANGNGNGNGNGNANANAQSQSQSQNSFLRREDEDQGEAKAGASSELGDAKIEDVESF